MPTLKQVVTKAAFDARQHRRRVSVMSAHRQARRDAIDSARDDTIGVFDTPDPDIAFLRRHPRYWTAEQTDTYDALRIDRMVTVATMAHEGHNGSRAAMVRPTDLPQVETVNATEVRHSERWTQDRPSKVKWPTKWDGVCYSITPDGTKAGDAISTQSAPSTPARHCRNHRLRD